MSIICNVYNGLDELIDFFPEDLLNEVLNNLNDDLNWLPAPAEGRVESLTSAELANKIEIFLRQINLIDEDDNVNSCKFWKDDQTSTKRLVGWDPASGEWLSNPCFYIPLHIDPTHVYKSIQIYLNDTESPGTAWFNIDMYHKFYDLITAGNGVLTPCPDPDIFNVYVGPKFIDVIKGKYIKYGKNRGYMLTNSSTEPLPHAVPRSFKADNRISLRVLIK